MNDIIKLTLNDFFSIDDWFSGYDDIDDFKKWFNNKYKDGEVDYYDLCSDYDGQPLDEVVFDGNKLYNQYLDEMN